jgi:hypothetical protein
MNLLRISRYYVVAGKSSLTVTSCTMRAIAKSLASLGNIAGVGYFASK